MIVRRGLGSNINYCTLPDAATLAQIAAAGNTYTVVSCDANGVPLSQVASAVEPVIPAATGAGQVVSTYVPPASTPSASDTALGIFGLPATWICPLLPTTTCGGDFNFTPALISAGVWAGLAFLAYKMLGKKR